MTNSIRSVLLAAIAKAGSFDELGRSLVETLADEFDAEVCTIWRRYAADKGATKLRLLAASAKAPQTLAQEVTYVIHDGDPEGRRADGITGYVAQTRREVHVSSFQQLMDEYGFCWRGLMDPSQWSGQPERHFKSLSALPLFLGERLVGVLKLENKRKSQEGFPEADRQALRSLVPDIALAVHSFSLLEPHEERLIKVPAKMVTALLGPFDARQLVNEIVKKVAEELHAEICSLWLVSTGASGKVLRLADGYGFSTEARAEQTYALAEASAEDEEIRGITAWVAVRKRPFWANSWEELQDHPSWEGKWDKAIWHQRDQSFRCLYATPLQRQSELIGVLKVENRIGAAFFTESDRALCEIMASLIVLVLDLGPRLRTSLISDFAHLMRSPIAQVPMHLSALEQEIRKIYDGGVPRFSRIETYLNFIKKALLAATMTSRTLVAFARMASDLPAGTPQKSRVELVVLIKERLTEVTPLLHSGITLETDFDDALKSAGVELDIADRTRAQIAIDNILHNAIKYSKDGGRVLISLKNDAGENALTIRDFGLGIAEDDVPHIFEAGFSQRAPGHPQGMGMGLPTVKQSLDRLGWGFHVWSTVNQGTTFRIMIPTLRGI